ncbi:MAG: ABC transporter permease [Dehalococcoidia bacterium]
MRAVKGTVATAQRVLRQLRRDPRTVAMLLVVPVVLVSLMKAVFAGGGAFQRVGVPLLGIFPLISMFLVTAVTMQRERSTGTLERLMSMPIAKLDLLLGYAIAFGVLAAVQATLTSVVAFSLLDLHSDGPAWAVVTFAVGNAVLGTALGLFVSAFARSEFQAVQFMPLFLMPQVFLCGLMAPRSSMPRALEIVSDYLPLTYAYDGLRLVATEGAWSGALARDIALVTAAAVASVALGAATLQRRTG